MSFKKKSMWDSLTPEEQQEFWNGMSQPALSWSPHHATDHYTILIGLI